jgi:hypothetical protein
VSDRKEDLNDPQVAMLVALAGLQSRMWTALPGIVISADLEAQTCSVQPAIQGVFFDRNNNAIPTNMPPLLDVPIVWPRAGGFAVTLPLAPGDEVIVVFSSRAIDSWWQSGEVGAPVEARMHDLSDGFAIPGPTSQSKKLADVQSDGIEIRTESRSTYIKLMDGTIMIKGDIIHEGNTEQTGDVTQTGNHIVTGDTTLNGSLLVTEVATLAGGAIINGGAVVSGALTNNGKNVGGNHTHPVANISTGPSTVTSGVPT